LNDDSNVGTLNYIMKKYHQMDKTT
jgi:hypothetical protein